MSRERLATAYDNLAEAYAQVALELRGADTPQAAPPSGHADTAGAGAPAPAPLPPRRTAPDDSAFTECPAHHQTFKEGRFGPYCSGQGEPDGNWFNDKGYCRVTPKSAGAWLKQHPRVTA
jgi:hypothetical protein